MSLARASTPAPPGRASRRALRRAAVALALGLFATSTALLPTPATAVSTDVVISQVYGGGGNTGATYTHDFIEIANRGSVPVDLSGWSVQYGSATGTSWAVTGLSGTVAPGGFFLVQQGKGAGGTTPLPTPDATGSIAMSATSGRVALVRSAAALTCGQACAAAEGVHDFLGYGNVTDFEGSRGPTLSNTTAALRTDAADSDNNGTDFTATAPAPRNSGGGDEPPPPPPPATRIAEIQGKAHLSPLAGKAVSAVPGVVTAVSKAGFWIQDPQPDSDPATSDGLFVFTRTAPPVQRGDSVTVSGTVTEFRSGGASSSNLTITEITSPTVTVVAPGATPPAPVLVGPGGRVAPTPVRTDAPGNVETSPVFDPAANALDFYEALEGMLVRVVDSVATDATARFGEIPVLPGGAGSPRTVRGGIRYTYSDPNAERVILDDLLAPMPAVNVGDVLPGPVDGVLDYSFSNFKLLPLATPAVTAVPLPRETTRPQEKKELAVATFNVENLDPTDPAEKFAKLAAMIVANLASPDILGLEEVQDNNGATNDAVVSADATYAKLIEAIVAAGGPRYEFRQVDPEDDQDGGQPGGNIRVGFLFNPDRVDFIDRPGATPTTATDVVADDDRAALTLSPGRVDPTNPAFEGSRKPLAAEVKFRGATVFLVLNHFSSKFGDQPLFGRFQPPTRGSEADRHAEARVVRGFVDKILSVDPRANVVVLGDVNDFEFSETTDILTAGGALVDLPRTLPEAERYSYVFEGNSQVLDHILISQALAQGSGYGRGFDYDIVHVNSEYADQVSDHDPQVVRLIPPPGL